jgi:hypothetical protein
MPVAARQPGRTVVSWKLMDSATLAIARLSAAAAACSVLLALCIPLAGAKPTADSQGYVDSTARCATPDTAVAFGSTESSRVAICKTPAGQYQYRGVRVRDGAKLILPATKSSDGAYVATDDGNTYTVTAHSLTVSQGNQVSREESMVDFHASGSPAAPAPSSAPKAAPPSAARPAPAATSTPSTPLPPPLPAEGGGRGRGH